MIDPASRVLPSDVVQATRISEYPLLTPSRGRAGSVIADDVDVSTTGDTPITYLKEPTMSFIRNMLALAGSTAATGALLLAPAASAAPSAGAATLTGAEQLQISGSFTTRDDDGSSRPTARSDFSRTVFLSASHRSETVLFNSACAGDEVRGELALQLILLSDGRVYVQDAPGGLGLKLFEGVSCGTTDLDGQVNIDDMVSFAGSTDTRSTSVGNQDEGGADLVSTSFRVAHTHLS
jgi:hypothetical protein